MPILTSMRNTLDRFLQGTCDHYSWYLPSPLGPFRRFLMKLLFSHVTIEDDQLDLIRHLPENATIVYVTKHKSRLERLFYHYYLGRDGLPCPHIGFYYRSYLWQPCMRLLRITVAHLVYFRRHWRTQMTGRPSMMSCCPLWRRTNSTGAMFNPRPIPCVFW